MDNYTNASFVDRDETLTDSMKTDDELIWIGYWHSEREPKLPKPEQSQPPWNPEIIAKYATEIGVKIDQEILEDIVSGAVGR